MAQPNPIYAAPTELCRYLNVYAYNYFAATELLPSKRQTLPNLLKPDLCPIDLGSALDKELL